MPSGPKPKPKSQPRSPLTQKVPIGMTGESAKAYRALAKELAIEGYACQADWRTVALTASTLVHAERLRDEVDNLPSFMCEESEKLHPLVTELRAVRAQLAGMYAQLLLTPRARSASRMTESQARTAQAKVDSLEDFIDG